MPTAAAECRRLGITGAVLASLRPEDIDTHLHLGDGADGVRAGVKFAEAVRVLLHGGAEDQAALNGGPRAVVAAEDARLGAAVVQALLDCNSGGAATSRGGGNGGGGGANAAEFPMAYLSRCTHGFDKAHEIGAGGFSTV